MDKYARLSTKRELIKVDIWFINQCLKHKVTPNFAAIKTSRNVPLRFKSELETKLQKKELCIHYARLNHLNTELKILYDNIVQDVPFNLLQDSLNSLSDDITYLKHTKFQKVNKKLKSLIHNKQLRSNLVNIESGKFSDFKFHDRVKNLSNCAFTQAEINFLNNGLKYALVTPLNTNLIEEFAVDIDSVLESLSLNPILKNTIKYSCFTSLQANLQKFNNSSFLKTKLFNQQKLIKSISTKINSHNLIVTKADKGNCLIIMNKLDYINKTESFLIENKFELLPRNPLSKFISIIKTNLKNNNQFFLDLNINYNKFIPSNPNIPRLYGLPKIHKDNIPMRPVVSFFNTPLSALSKFVNNFLTETLKFSPRFTVKNSSDLITQLSNSSLPLHNYLLVSFDVSNLFTNVPREETIPLIQNLLLQLNFDPAKTSQLISLLKLCLSQDFFSFNEKFYRQPKGLAMGNPLSPSLSDLFLDNLENNHIFNNNNSSFGRIKSWYRYVDDVLAFIEGSPQDCQQILTSLNSIHPSIKFTLEIESNKSINFLDLTIHRLNDRLDFAIYHKPTQTDHLIPASSTHPFSQKMAAIYCYTNRLLKVPLSDSNFKKEWDFLKQIAYNNGYDPNIISKTINKLNFKYRRRLAFNPSPSNLNNHIYRSLPYYGQISNNIASVLTNKIESLKISFKAPKTINSLISRNKDAINLLQRSGIYRLTCGDCNTTYIGRTIRPLATRIKEHLSRIDKSNFGFHIKSYNHNFSPNRNSKILHRTQGQDFNKLNLLEDLEILRELKNNPNNCLNTQVHLNCNFKPLFKFFWES